MKEPAAIWTIIFPLRTPDMKTATGRDELIVVPTPNLFSNLISFFENFEMLKKKSLQTGHNCCIPKHRFPHWSLKLKSDTHL